MAELAVEDVQAQVQACLNCLELCRALYRQIDEPAVKEKLASLVDGLQEVLATLASHLRRWGAPSGDFEPDRQGKARIHQVLGMRSLPGQLQVVRKCLADIVAWYTAHQDAGVWLASLAAQTQELLDAWDHGMREVKATR
ncbi:MAG: hypothetical protein Kow0063_08860 [Anaerolineae bacterium]